MEKAVWKAFSSQKLEPYDFHVSLGPKIALLETQ